MNKKRKSILLIILITTLVISIAAICAPKLTSAEMLNWNWDWTEYEINGDHCNNIRTDHLVFSENNSVIDFYGHYSIPYLELAVTDPGSKIESEFFNFTLNEETTDWHTLVGSGFLLNADISNYKIHSGYFVMYGQSAVTIYKVKSDITIPNQNLTVTNQTPIASVSKPNSKIHKISIQATQNHIKYMDNDVVLFDIDIDRTGGYEFGPFVQWGSHCCRSESHIQFTNVLCGTNIKAPIADFSYNLPFADLRTPVTVIDSSRDRNTPEQELTYCWTVSKKGDDGTEEIIWDNQPTPFTGYNSSGVGVYTTTLAVKNECDFWSTSVTKRLEITASPQISIEADKEEYRAGDTVSYTLGDWWNCSPETSNLTIENIPSQYVINPSLIIPGSNQIKKTSGELKTEITFKYTDETINTVEEDIPPEGKTISDPHGINKQVSSISIKYESLPTLAEIEEDNGIVISYLTSPSLAYYYNKGVGESREYKLESTAVLAIESQFGILTANSDEESPVIEDFVSFSLEGTINNNNAITQPPACNTEFLLSGQSLGGEEFSKYIIVTNGKSELIKLPSGTYTLSEVEAFTQGYDIIPKMELEITSDGIKINDKKIILDGNAIPFEKVLQVATVTVSRSYESAGGLDLLSDTDFKTNLTGTTVVQDIDVSFELISNPTTNSYSYEDETNLILPIGTFAIEETQKYRYVELDYISANNNVLWDRVLNANKESSLKSISFLAKKDQTIPVELKYISEGYVYSEYIAETELVISAVIKNQDNMDVTKSDIEKVLVDPNTFSYPVILTNLATNEKYYGNTAANASLKFRYLPAGRYEIKLPENMYMDLGELKKINSEGLVFEETNGLYYVTLPEETYSYGEFIEESILTDWRGYSSIESTSSKIATDTKIHVSFTAMAYDQENHSVANCKFQLIKDGEPVYFIKKANKLYPSDKTQIDAIDTFETDEEGNFYIYKIIQGEYTLKRIDSSDLINTVEEQTINIDNSDNVGVILRVVDPTKVESPSEIVISTSKNTINLNEKIQLDTQIKPSNTNKNIKYSSSDEAILSVDEKGVVTAIGIGSATITATSLSDNDISGQITLTVIDPENPAVKSITQNVLLTSMSIGDTYTSNVTITPSTAIVNSLIWETSDADVVTVNNGVITAVGAGSADVTVKYGDLVSTCHIFVDEIIIPVKSIILSSNKVDLIANHITLNSYILSTSVIPETATDTTITYTSNNPDIVSVDSQGRLTALTEGIAIITATSSNGISDTCIVSAQNIVDEIKLNLDTVTLSTGSKAQISSSIYPINAINPTITWESSNDTIATVDKNGLITANAPGKATLTASTSYEGSGSITKKCVVTVVDGKIEATNIDVCLNDEFKTLEFTDAIEMSSNDSITFFARVRPISSTDPEIEWTVSNPKLVAIAPANKDEYSENLTINEYKIASISDMGGTVTITGTVKSNPSITTSFKVDVVRNGNSVDFYSRETIENDTYVIGKTEPISLTVKSEPEGAPIKSVEWTLSDTSLATISSSEDGQTATITPTKSGSLTITAEVEYRKGGEYSTSIEINIEDPSISIYDENHTKITTLDVNIGEKKYFSLENNFPKDSSDSGASYTYDTSLITISNGENPSYGWGFYVEGLAEGSQDITFNPSDSTMPSVTLTIFVSDNSNEESNEGS